MEEFTRSCTDHSIQAYSGKLHSYTSPHSSLGYIEVQLVSSPSEPETKELVIFHTDAVWLRDVHTTDARLKPGTQVYFNARRLPPGLVEGRKFQAKSVWIGQDTQPNYVSAPSARRLDDWLEPLVRCSTSPDSSEARSATDTGKTSPVLRTARQKPLKGGLNQLGAQNKAPTVVHVKKALPTNFAQAVAPAPIAIKENLSTSIGNEYVKKIEPIDFDPFSKDIEPPKHERAAANSWEELDDRAYDPLKTEDDTSNDADANEIDLDELDDYYDELSGIINYLENELPKIIPKIAKDEKCFQALATKVVAAPRTADGETKELRAFLELHSIPSRIIAIFIAEFIKFRNYQNNREHAKKPVATAAPNESTKTAFEEAKDFYKVPTGGAAEATRQSPVAPQVADTKLRGRVESFLTWLERVVRNPEMLSAKLQLYCAVLERPTTLTRVWYEVATNAVTPTDAFISFITAERLGEARLARLQRWVTTEAMGGADWGTFTAWLEGDTNLFRAEGEVKDAGGDDRASRGEPGKQRAMASLDLSPLEQELSSFLDMTKETSGYIFRSIVLLRRGEVRLVGLLSLHLRVAEELGGKGRGKEEGGNNKVRNKELQNRVQQLLERTVCFVHFDPTQHFLPQVTQKTLDDTNTWVGREAGGREHVPISHR